jgi:hypothetical protein
MADLSGFEEVGSHTNPDQDEANHQLEPSHPVSE